VSNVCGLAANGFKEASNAFHCDAKLQQILILLPSDHLAPTTLTGSSVQFSNSSIARLTTRAKLLHFREAKEFKAIFST
jgi:hypothetical protein